MDWELQQPKGQKHLHRAAQRDFRPTPAGFGWLSTLLLVLLAAGCRVASPVSDFRSTVATGPVEASAVCSATLESPGDFPAARVVESGESVPNWPREPARPVRLASLNSELPAGATSGATSGAMGPLRLEDAIALTLERNPDLAAVRAGEPVAEAAFHVARTYPWNPQLQTQVLPYSRDRDGNDGAVSQQHVIVQTFELGGQRRFRVGAAAANWDQVRGTIQRAELISAAQTTRLFLAALYQRELRDMNQVMAELSEQLVGVIDRREQAGQAIRADVELARLQAQSSRRQQRLAEANYQTALMDLRNQMNLDAHFPLELAGQWVNWQWRPLAEVLGVGPQRTWPPSDAGELKTEPEGSSAANLAEDDGVLRPWVARRPDVIAARAAIRRYERARRLVEQSRDELAPDSPEALLPFENQFKAGQITLLEVFAARAALAQSRQSFLDLLNELALAAANVTQAIGLPPQAFVETNINVDAGRE